MSAGAWITAVIVIYPLVIFGAVKGGQWISETDAREHRRWRWAYLRQLQHELADREERQLSTYWEGR